MSGKINNRIGQEAYNNKGCLMKIIEYNNERDIIVEFQDKYKAIVHTSWKNFEDGTVRNPNHQSVYDVGVIGDKYSTTVDKK